jgi:hypothetical protein
VRRLTSQCIIHSYGLSGQGNDVSGLFSTRGRIALPVRLREMSSQEKGWKVCVRYQIYNMFGREQEVLTVEERVPTAASHSPRCLDCASYHD